MLSLSDEELEQDTAEWFNGIEEDEEFEILRSEMSVSLKLPGKPTLSLCVSPETEHLMRENSLTLFEALYHEALTSYTVSSLQPFLKCSTLRCCYIMPYNPMYLLCLKSRAQTTLIGSNQLDIVRQVKRGHDDMSLPLDPLYEGCQHL